MFANLNGSTLRDTVQGTKRILTHAQQTTRRTFIKLTAAAASTGALDFPHAEPVGTTTTLINDADSALIASDPVRWAAEEFRQALRVSGISH
jgi:hypothetical protein